MYTIIDIVNNISKDESVALKKFMGKDSIKYQLIDLVANQGIKDEEELLEHLGYSENRQAYYTLKHRLVSSLIECKKNLGINVITETLEYTENLRTLLYSENTPLFTTTINKLEKKAIQLELYRALPEVYFNYYLFYYNNPKMREKYLGIYNKANQDLLAFTELEMLFFNSVFETVDLFYYQTDDLLLKQKAHLRKMKKINDRLNSNISQFMYLSGKLNLELIQTKKVSPSMIKDLDLLYELYIKTPLKYKIPDCYFALLTLYNKFYFLTGEQDAFDKSLNDLDAGVKDILGYRTYENVLFYYLYIKIYSLVSKQEYNKVSQFIKGLVDEKMLSNVSNKMKYYMHYLLALSHFYNGEYSNAHSSCLQAIGYKRYLEEQSQWIHHENMALMIIVQFKHSHKVPIDYYLKKLRKGLRTHKVDRAVWVHFFSVVKSLRKRKLRRDDDALMDFISERGSRSILKLVDLKLLSPFMYHKLETA